MRGCSSAAPQMVATAWVTFELGAAAGVAWTRPVPPECDLSTLTLELESPATEEAWTMYLSHDALGEQPITDYATSGGTRTAVPALSASDQVLSWDLGNIAFFRRPGGGIYCHLKQEGTDAAATPVLTWRGDP